MSQLNINAFDEIKICQFGKVASTSLYYTLRELHKNVIHTHIINPIPHESKTLLITMTRNLFDRNISTFFESIQADGLWHYEQFSTDPLNYTDEYINKMCEDYRSKNLIHLRDPYITRWFETLSTELNFNIFSLPFDVSKKYLLHQIENITLLILRFEDVHSWRDIFTDIFGINMTMVWYNVSSNKDYKVLFNLFKTKYKISEEEINIVKNIDFINHFYNNDEIESFIEKYNK